MPDAFNRLTGARSTLGVKAPCRVATTANITLSGLQTVNGVALAENERVLVKDQSDATTNGIRIASSGAWARATDFDGNTDFVEGTQVYVTDGSAGIGMYVLTTADPIEIGVSAIVFAAAPAVSHFLQSGAGAVARTQQAKARDILHVKDFGAVGDGVTNDTVAITAAKTEVEVQRNGIVALSGGRFVGGQQFTSGSPIWTNNVSPLLLRTDKPTILGLFEGTDALPDAINDDPILWIQKFTQFDNGTDANAQSVGGILSEVIIKGSGASGATETDAVWTSILGNAVAKGVNQGTEGAPDYDWDGSVIGVAGFARSEKPPSSAGIITALWGYATSPSVTNTEFAAHANAFSTVGLEINIENRHQDPGALSDFGFKGTTAGILLGNFPSAIGKRDWSFGVVCYPIPQDGNFSSTDPDNFNGFHDVVFADCYKRAGIRFGRGRSTAYGILFPASYTHANFRPAAAIHLGDNQINLGSYTNAGSVVNDGDFWHNSNVLFFRNNGVSAQILQSRSNIVLLPGNTNFSVTGGFVLNLTTVASAVNYLTLTNAATAGLPVLDATGSDTNISLLFRAKGNARHDFATGNGTQFTILNGGASTANILSVTGASAASPPVLGATGSDTNIDVRITPKGTGIVTSAASLRAHSGTAVPAGGTAGAGVLVSSVTNFGVFFGSGAPSLSAAQGSLYIRSDGSATNNRAYVNTNGTTSWASITTSS